MFNTEAGSRTLFANVAYFTSNHMLEAFEVRPTKSILTWWRKDCVMILNAYEYLEYQRERWARQTASDESSCYSLQSSMKRNIQEIGTMIVFMIPGLPYICSVTSDAAEKFCFAITPSSDVVLLNRRSYVTQLTARLVTNETVPFGETLECLNDVYIYLHACMYTECIRACMWCMSEMMMFLISISRKIFE